MIKKYQVWWLNFNNWLWQRYAYPQAGNEILISLNDKAQRNYAGALLLENTTFEARRMRETINLWKKGLTYYKDNDEVYTYLINLTGSSVVGDIATMLDELKGINPDKDSLITIMADRVRKNRLY